MNHLQVFTYQNTPITFEFEAGEVMVNATEMGKPFGKLPKDFLKNRQTRSFIEALSRKENYPTARIVRVVNGGTMFGTWMHKKLALKYAGWLNPDFELWVYDRIEDLLTKGHTSVKQLTPSEILLQQAQLMVEQERRLDVVEKDLIEVKAKQITSPQDYYAIAGYAALIKKQIDRTIAAKIGAKAKAICRQRGIYTGVVPDLRFGFVGTYPTSVLREVFWEIFKE